MTFVTLGRSGELWEGLFCVGGCGRWRQLPPWAPGTSPEETTGRPRDSVVPRGSWGPWSPNSQSSPPSGPDLGVVPSPAPTQEQKGFSAGTGWTWFPPPGCPSPEQRGVNAYGVVVGIHLAPSLPSQPAIQLLQEGALGAPWRPRAQLRENPPPLECPGNTPTRSLPQGLLWGILCYWGPGRT